MQKTTPLRSRALHARDHNAGNFPYVCPTSDVFTFVINPKGRRQNNLSWHANNYFIS